MRKAILSLLMTLAAIIANAQTDDETLLFIYKNGGHFYAFNSFEIDSIVFAIDKKEDKEIVVQEIYTSKGVSRHPLETISRMEFIPTETVLSTTVFTVPVFPPSANRFILPGCPFDYLGKEECFKTLTLII